MNYIPSHGQPAQPIATPEHIVNQLNRLQLEVAELRKRLDAHDRMFKTFDGWTNKIADGIDEFIREQNNNEYSRCL